MDVTMPKELLPTYKDQVGPARANEVDDPAPLISGYAVAIETGEPPTPREDPPTHEDPVGHVDCAEDSKDISPPKGKDDFSLVRHRSRVFWVLVILVVVAVFVAVVVGSICGAGKCAANSSSSETSAAPNTSTSTTRSPTTTATTVPAPPTISSAPPGTGTARPTTAEEARAAAIALFINDIKFSANKILYPPSSTRTPEEQAVEWLVTTDPLQLTAVNDADQFRLRQRYALLTLWYHTDGPSWENKTGWLEAEEECTWFGIACASSLPDVSGVELVANDLQGRTPDDIALMTSLEDFSARSNRLTGTLPDSIGALTKMVTFSVSSNSMTGTIPHSIGLWFSLRSLALSGNDFIGTVPASICTLKDNYVLEAVVVDEDEVQCPLNCCTGL